MAYGLEVWNSEGTWKVIETQRSQTTTAVLFAGNGSSCNFFAGDFVAIRKTVASGSYADIYTRTTVVTGNIYQMNFYVSGSSGVGTTVDYVIIRPASSFTLATGYGLQCFASDGTTLTFDSSIFQVLIILLTQITWLVMVLMVIIVIYTLIKSINILL